MADSSTPNLLGASEGFNELANQLSSIKSFLQGALEAPIETVVAELIGSLGILDGDFSALIQELSSIADISFILLPHIKIMYKYTCNYNANL